MDIDLGELVIAALLIIAALGCVAYPQLLVVWN